MKITLIKHSTVLIEMNNHQLLFDYYDGEINLNKNKPLYIFASHSHQDHYSNKIFSLNHPHKIYILSDDIQTSVKAYQVSSHQIYTIDDLIIETYLSTDLGVAFRVNTEDKEIYFAGDLHNWHWIGEPKDFLNKQKTIYTQELKRISKHRYDISFVVVDDRLEDTMFEGLQEFLKTVQSHYIFPIHYFENYTISSKLKKEKLDNPYHASLLYPDHNYFNQHLFES